MTTIIPQSDQIKKAVKWFSEERQAHPDKSLVAIAGEAAVKFDLSPSEAEYLENFTRQES